MCIKSEASITNGSLAIDIIKDKKEIGAPNERYRSQCHIKACVCHISTYMYNI